MISAPSTIDAVPTWAVVVVAVLVGLVVGSFLNVVVYRLPRHLSVSKPRSFCPTCKRQLAWWENVPLVSWVALRGRCHVCREPISVRYPLVEAANALAFGLVAAAWHGTATAVAYCLLVSTLLTIVLIDLGSLRAPLALAAVGTAVADLALIAASGWTHHWSILIGAQVGILVGAAGFAVLRRLDPECLRPEGIGRSALLPTGCWLGGLVPWATVIGLGAGVVVFGALLLALRRPLGTGDGAAMGNPVVSALRRSAQRPLLPAVVVGVAVGLLAYA